MNGEILRFSAFVKITLLLRVSYNSNREYMNV